MTESLLEADLYTANVYTHVHTHTHTHTHTEKRAPSGGTRIKHRHLKLLGYKLVSIPYWEWELAKQNVRSIFFFFVFWFAYTNTTPLNYKLVSIPYWE